MNKGEIQEVDKKNIHRAFTILSTKTVQGAARALEGVDNVESGDGFTMKVVQHWEQTETELAQATYRLACSV